MIRYYWNRYSPFVAGALLVLLAVSYFSCSPEVVTIEKPTVEIKETIKRDTVLRTIEVTNEIYIPVSAPTLNTATRAVLDTVIKQDSAQASLHVEFNKETENFENVMAAFEVPVATMEVTVYRDREIRIEIPSEVEKPDTDDLQWFGLGSVVGVLLTIIGVLAL
jgi:hypothetical protein